MRLEIESAIRVNPTLFARLRDLVAADVPLQPSHATDDEILARIGWLLQTERLALVECIEVRRELPDPLRKPQSAVPRGVPVPLEDTKTWVEIELLAGGKPVPNERYRVKVPGGVIEEGKLDGQGRARIVNLDDGMCDISFPDIDGREWGAA